MGREDVLNFGLIKYERGKKNGPKLEVNPQNSILLELKVLLKKCLKVQMFKGWSIFVLFTMVPQLSNTPCTNGKQPMCWE